MNLSKTAAQWIKCTEAQLPSLNDAHSSTQLHAGLAPSAPLSQMVLKDKIKLLSSLPVKSCFLIMRVIHKYFPKFPAQIAGTSNYSLIEGDTLNDTEASCTNATNSKHWVLTNTMYLCTLFHICTEVWTNFSISGCSW